MICVLTDATRGSLPSFLTTTISDWSWARVATIASCSPSGLHATGPNASRLASAKGGRRGVLPAMGSVAPVKVMRERTPVSRSMKRAARVPTYSTLATRAAAAVTGAVVPSEHATRAAVAPTAQARRAYLTRTARARARTVPNGDRLAGDVTGVWCIGREGRTECDMGAC